MRSEGCEILPSRPFQLGAGLSADEKLLGFYVAACGWGSGSKAMMVRCVARPLHAQGKFDAPANPEFLMNLRTALEVGEADGPVAGFYAFNNKSHNKIAYLGAAFYTKLLHFAVPVRQADGTTQSLILDARVASGLGFHKYRQWTTPEYENYLDVVNTLRERWCSDLAADAVEYQLFMAGKR